jgi:hypothetical protein
MKMQTAPAADPLSFENCAADVAKMLGKSVAAALDLANAYQRNLGWDEKKLFARAQEIGQIGEAIADSKASPQ